MEGQLGAANMQESFWNYRQLLPLVEPDPKLPVSDWTVIDLDNYLRGNPHIQQTEKEQWTINQSISYSYLNPL